jgi:uncharacterized repeat protein (TIGR03803 family)
MLSRKSPGASNHVCFADKGDAMAHKALRSTTRKFVSGLATLVTAAMLAAPAWAAHYRILYEFTGAADGGTPIGVLALDASGNLYGTTTAGGASGNGTVFELSRNADGSFTERVLYSFAGGKDGALPYGAVALNTAGDIFGTTQLGGASSDGTIFQLVNNGDGGWTENVLHSFNGSDGASPLGNVVFDTAGNVYGMTGGGGINGQGVAYRLAPSSGSWTYSVIHAFTGGKDGSYPLYQSGLIFDHSGNLYGATSDGVDSGGDCNGEDCGSIIELTPNLDGSWGEGVIYRFHDGTPESGRKPAGNLTFDSAGHLFGAANGGGSFYGNVFELTLGSDAKWHELTLRTFRGNQDGAYTTGGLVFDGAGNLYGTTADGEDADGACCFGQVFTLLPRTGGWAKYALWRFRGHWDGDNPAAGLVIDSAGNLYGTTQNGGNHGQGVVFEYLQ